MRALGSLGKISSVPSDFKRPCESVTHGGVLLALPALLATGLLRHAARFFTLPAGFYGLEHIFMLLGMLALCRIKSIEALRSTAPGEWGKLLGLDRCPEAKTLREKIKILTTEGDGKAWAAQLCKDWMAANPAATATLYIDGHARAYHGHLTKLPRHYIARERLCLRATTDYWVNGLDGLPFFKINQSVDPGLICATEEQIVPELELLVPNQPPKPNSTPTRCACVSGSSRIAKATAPAFSNAWPPSASPARPITNTPVRLGRKTSSPSAKCRS